MELSKVSTSKKSVWTKDPSSRVSALPDRVKIKEVFPKKGEYQMKVIPEERQVAHEPCGCAVFTCEGSADSGNQK